LLTEPQKQAIKEISAETKLGGQSAPILFTGSSNAATETIAELARELGRNIYRVDRAHRGSCQKPDR